MSVGSVIVSRRIYKNIIIMTKYEDNLETKKPHLLFSFDNMCITDLYAILTLDLSPLSMGSQIIFWVIKSSRHD